MKQKLKPEFKLADDFLELKTTDATIEHLDELREARDSCDLFRLAKVLKR